MISPLRVAVVPALFLVFAGAACNYGANVPTELAATFAPIAPAIWPDEASVWTSSREITAVRETFDAVWAATTGGVLRLENGAQTRWSARDGLPANDVFAVQTAPEIAVNTFRGAAKWDGKSWRKTEFLPQVSRWRGHEISFSPDDLRWNGQKFALPPSSKGTHITGAVPDGEAIRVAVFGEGFWLFDGQSWRFDGENLPPENAREITALAPRMGAQIVFGTRRNGVWRGVNRSWRPISSHDDEPHIANVQSFARFRGALFASTLDDGIVFRSGQNWGHVAAPTLSSTAARHLVSFGEKLWVRHGTGVVDSFDGTVWRRNDLRPPRAGVYALDADEKRLAAAGWGGFALFDGQNWAPFYDLPALKGVPIVGISLDGDAVWLLTQSRGLMRFSGGEITVFDERNGFQDDWITAFARGGNERFAGTFVGGLHRFDGQKWVPFAATRGENITALAPIPNGVLAASRSGLWRVQNGEIERVSRAEIEPELQAILVENERVFLGGRTSFASLPTIP